MRHLLGIFAIASLASGCALSPHAGPHGGTVMEDALLYLSTEWPLEPDCQCANECSGGCTTPSIPQQGAVALHAGKPLGLGHHDQPPLLRREPAVYESGGPPGRFHPAPTKPPFQPSGVRGPAMQ